MKILCKVYIILSNRRTDRCKFMKLASIDITTAVISRDNRISELPYTAEMVGRETLGIFAEEHNLQSVELTIEIKVSML